MNLVLDEEVDEGHERAKERARNDLPVLDGLGVRWAQGNAAQGPRKRCDDVGDHENVVPIMVVGRGDVCEAAASQGSENAHEEHEPRQPLAGFPGEEVP